MSIKINQENQVNNSLYWRNTDFITNFEFWFCYWLHVTIHVEINCSFILLFTRSIGVNFFCLNVLCCCILSIFVAVCQDIMCCLELWIVSTFSVLLLCSIFQQHWIFIHFLLSVFLCCVCPTILWGVCYKTLFLYQPKDIVVVCLVGLLYQMFQSHFHLYSPSKVSSKRICWKHQ